MLNEKETLAISNALGKSTPNVIVGASEAGKSTMISGLARSEIVYTFLARRTSNGKGSLINSEVIITDDPNINDEKLYISGEITKKTLADISDDNDLLGKVLFSGALEISKKGDYEDKLRRAFINEIKNPPNNSLAYKIASMNEEQKQEILNIIYCFSREVAFSLYEEVKILEKNSGKKGQYAKNLFIAKLKDCEEFKENIQKFWDAIVEFINDSATSFITGIKDIANIEIKSNDTTSFELSLGESDISNNIDIVNTLLKSENASKEYLFSKLSLIFRGVDWLFQYSNIDAFTAIEDEQGNKIHVLRFIDTMGLFHEQGKEADAEYERVVDILSEYHCDRVIFVLSADVNTTVKNGYEAMHKFFQDVNRDVKAFLISTKWDLLLQNRATQSSGMNRFGANNGKGIKLDEVFTQAKDEFVKLIDSFEDDIANNSNRRKAIIKGVYSYGLTGVNLEINDILDKNNLLYMRSMDTLIKNLCDDEELSGEKIRVSATDNIVSAIKLKNNMVNVSAIYNGLITNKNKKLYASTVGACNRKWKIGTKHKSNVFNNDYGYENIETEFVLYIGNYAKEIAKDAVVLDENCFRNNKELERFYELLIAEISRVGSFGKYFAGIVYEDAYKHGFLSRANLYMPQYERFRNMLIYVEKNYFYSSSIAINSKIEECIKDAVMRVVNIIINERCIIVF